MAHRLINGFHQDDAGDWVAELECGHTQHVRHRPPFEHRAWVTHTEGRHGKLGTELDCNFCDMPTLPEQASVYKRTPTFDETTTPAGLLREHRTRRGTWGRLIVLEGYLTYEVLEPTRQSWVLRPGVAGIIAPERAHRVSPAAHTKFHVEFLRCEEPSEPAGSSTP